MSTLNHRTSKCNVQAITQGQSDPNTHYKGLLYYSVNWTFIYFQTGASGLLSCPEHVCVLCIYMQSSVTMLHTL